ncbi:tRNA nucleotidyltransferase/poly(A) polymerase [Silvibacterium bohemicum]|uniref:tRNA nucleotidyltransferase/poly(A) polymerase n=1 Tax=Silvibacterium bohemicum TaxID=1577686 RepID=A0A841JYY1_9BACT|nr:tRNA nucleotidyltransferase [Silvibacterium bohemicum]MBB6146536.1 tRNA nucleotidyltransferase/poly(A) polymerase [Silvibacterium bohemicum]
MPDYVYLLENRLSPVQQNALKQVRDVVRAHGINVFLTGGAVRDLTTGFPVRDLDFTVQGNALKLKKDLEKAGAILWGEHDPSRTLFFWLNGVRVEVSSARSEQYPKPGKPVYEWAPILEDLRRRDFTANAMAISLNEGSYGLLLDPLNGIADLESRTLRLVSPYGFIEDPSRLLRATRLIARTNWELDERSKTRYENAKEENSIEAISPYLKGYELEEIGHEEDALKALKALENEGWMKHIDPAWTSARADLQGLEALHAVLLQFLIQGIHPDLSAAQMELLTAKMPPKELEALKKQFPRTGFVAQWEALDEAAKEFQKELLDKKNAAPSAAWKLITSYAPEAVLWLAYTSKNAAVQTRFKNFFTVWPEARQKIPSTLMLEMRITPDLPGYSELVQEIFFQLMDGKLSTDEEMRAFLEPHSPPAPPPPVSIRRTRTKKSDIRVKDEDDEDDDASPSPGDDDNDDGDDDNDDDEDDSDAEEDDEDLHIAKPVKAKPASTKAAPVKAAPVKAIAASAAEGHPQNHSKAAAPKSELESKAHPAKAAAVKSAPAKSAPAQVEQAKHAVVKPAPAGKTVAPAKSAAPPPKKAPAKAVPHKPAVAAKKGAPAKKAVVKPVAHPAKKAAKPASKPAPHAAKKLVKKPAPKPAKKPVHKPAHKKH